MRRSFSSGVRHMPHGAGMPASSGSADAIHSCQSVALVSAREEEMPWKGSTWSCPPPLVLVVVLLFELPRGVHSPARVVGRLAARRIRSNEEVEVVPEVEEEEEEAAGGRVTDARE